MPRGSYTTEAALGAKVTPNSEPTSFLVPTATAATGGFTPQAVTHTLSAVMFSVALQPRWTAVLRAVTASVPSSAFELRMFCYSRLLRSRGKPIAMMTPIKTNANINSIKLKPLRPMCPPFGG